MKVRFDIYDENSANHEKQKEYLKIELFKRAGRIGDREEKD